MIKGGREKQFTRWSHKPKTSGAIPVSRNQFRIVQGKRTYVRLFLGVLGMLNTI